MELSPELTDFMARNYWFTRVKAAVDSWETGYVGVVNSVYGDKLTGNGITIVINFEDAVSEQDSIDAGGNFRSMLEALSEPDVSDVYYNRSAKYVFTDFSLNYDIVDIP